MISFESLSLNSKEKKTVKTIDLSQYEKHDFDSKNHCLLKKTNKKYHTSQTEMPNFENLEQKHSLASQKRFKTESDQNRRESFTTIDRFWKKNKGKCI